jgi:hypothetical protein
MLVMSPRRERQLPENDNAVIVAVGDIECPAVPVSAVRAIELQ